jgi:hypothetical protein
MNTRGKRAAAGAGTVVLAAATNIATGVVTQHWALAWWVGVAVLVVLGAALQAWLTVGEREAGRQVVQGTKVGGSIRQIMTGPGEQSVTASETGDLTQQQ